MAAQDLTTVEDVRRFMQKQNEDADQDALIGSLITSASDQIQRTLSRQFAPTETAAAKVFAHYGGRQINLAPYDLRTVTSIVLDTHRPASEQTTLTTDDYSLRPKPNRDGTYAWVRLLNHFETSDEREVTITGNWGFSSVPKEVAHWTIITVVTWMRRDVSVFERTFNLAEDRVERPRELPSAVIAGLAHYKRPTLP